MEGPSLKGKEKSAGEDQMPSPTTPKNHLGFLSINLRQAPTKLVSLKRSLNEQKEPPWSIIFIQDPPPDFPWAKRIKSYNIHCHTSRQLTQVDHPWYNSKKKKKSKSIDQNNTPRPRNGRLPDDVELSGVAFLVNSNRIRAKDWKVIDYDKDDSNNLYLVATLVLATDYGEVAFHNVYNRNNPDKPGSKLDIDELMALCLHYENNVIVGDLNLYHPSWAGDKGKPVSVAAEKLFTAITFRHMRLLNTPGTATFSRGVPNPDGSQQSTVDLVFATEHIARRKISWRVVKEIRGFETDHRVTETVLELETHTPDPRFFPRWHKVDKRRTREAAKSRFDALGKPPLVTKENVDKYLASIIHTLQKLQDDFVPMRTFSPPPPVPLDKGAADALRLAMEAYNAGDIEKYKRLKAISASKERNANTKSYRQYTHEASQDDKGTQRLARQAIRRFKPTNSVHCPTLVHGEKRFSTAAEKVECLRMSSWPKTSDDTAVNPVEFVPDPNRETRFCSQEVTDSDVRCVLNELEPKAPGNDGVYNSLLKMIKEEIVSTLHHLFSACFRLSYIPTRCKEASTLMLPKPSKPLHEPRSWRPIALLLGVGKLLESILAKRISQFCHRYKILHKAQFGVKCKSAAEAISNVVGFVLDAWNSKIKMYASLLGLDIRGAFDTANRDALLKLLVLYMFPQWIFDFMRSFVSDRRTTLSIWGQDPSAVFFINVGISQGSPLSSIAFAIIISSLFYKLDAQMPRLGRAKVEFVGYVDDIHMVASSPSYKRNNEVFENLHKIVQEWAEENEIVFEPKKYSVIHFKPSGRGPRKPNNQAQLQDQSQAQLQDQTQTPAQDQDQGQRRPRGRHRGKLVETGPPCFDELPDIPEIPKESLKTNVRILGVILDHRLSWGPHIQSIHEKVFKKMWCLNSTSSSVHGPPVSKMRILYLTGILPIITYAASAWWIRRKDGKYMKGSVTKDNIKQIQTLQRSILKAVAGAMKTTSTEMVLKELNLPSIETTLDRIAMVQRASQLLPDYVDVEEGKVAERATAWLPNKPKKYRIVGVKSEHPYNFLENDARTLILETDASLAFQNEDGRPGGDCSLNRSKLYDSAKEDERTETSERWVQFQQERKAKLPKWLHEQALSGRRGPKTLKLYDNLPRAHGTILMQCRTGVIGLKSYLKKINRADDSKCRCGADETVEHLFCHCPLLAEERSLLARNYNDFNIRNILTSKKNLKLATDFAIKNFGLDQFQYARATLEESKSQNQAAGAGVMLRDAANTGPLSRRVPPM